MAVNYASLNATFNSMRSNLFSMQADSRLKLQGQDRLQTGQKVNTAMDDPVPVNYSAALSSRVSSDSLSISAEAYGKYQQIKSDDSLKMADTNEGAANMLELQTRRALNIMSLSMSSYSSRNSLQLFA